MKRAIVIILVLVCAQSSFAGELIIAPTYDGSLSWEASIDKVLRQIYDDLRNLLMPADGRISSQYGMRHHPILQIKRHHNGIDIACGVGTPIKAVLSGVIRSTVWHGGYGRLVKIEHWSEGLESRYAHLSKISVAVGQRVDRGDVIGYSGQTGLATGPHLHFELYQDGKLLDPDLLLGTSVATRIPKL